MSEALVVGWFWAFFFTQLIEIPIYTLGLRARPAEAFLASAITHPIVWFVIPPAFEQLYLALLAPHPSLWLAQGPRYWIMAVVAEVFAVSVEAAYWASLRKSNAWRWSIAANATSFLMGFVRRSVFESA